MLIVQITKGATRTCIKLKLVRFEINKYNFQSTREICFEKYCLRAIMHKIHVEFVKNLNSCTYNEFLSTLSMNNLYINIKRVVL